MKRKIFVVFLISLFVLVSFTTTGIKTSNDIVTNSELRPLMKVDYEILEDWRTNFYNAETAFIDPALKAEIQATTSFSILDYLDYVPEERNQGRCSNCWAWPSTGVLGIALYVQEGIFERLSVQYLNSCGTVVGSECCEGGTLDIFTQFYRHPEIRKAIPWSNDNAHWQDGNALCLTPCGLISTEPNYPIDTIRRRPIRTNNIPEEEAIENVKNILHQEKGVYFSWFLPDMDYRQHFGDYWREGYEDEIYDLDWDCGAVFDEEEGGGHAVLCVGYNDDEGTNNDYWIMLNSWGTADNRPNGLFAVNMHMDYDCIIYFGEQEYYSMGFQTLSVEFGSGEEAPRAPTIDGPDSGQAGTEYTYQISAVDNQGDDVYFSIDWDDGNVEEWLGPVASGEQFEVSHTWSRRKTYAIKVKAKDTNDAESLTSIHEMPLSKSKLVKISFFRFLQEPYLLKRLIQSLI
jgi:hypothetical protein